MSSSEPTSSLPEANGASTPPPAVAGPTEVSAASRKDSPLPEMPAVRRTGRKLDGATMPSRQQQWLAAHPRPRSWIAWLPLAVGVALGIGSPLLRSLLSPLAPWGLRLVFPFVQLLGLHEIGMSDELTRTLPQLMLYLQFPLEGLLARNSLNRGLSVASALGQIIFLHLIGALALWLVSMATLG